MKSLMMRVVRDEEGQDLIEYALLAAFIALACMAGLTAVSGGINALFTDVSNKLQGK